MRRDIPTPVAMKVIAGVIDPFEVRDMVLLNIPPRRDDEGVLQWRARVTREVRVACAEYVADALERIR